MQSCFIGIDAAEERLDGWFHPTHSPSNPNPKLDREGNSSENPSERSVRIRLYAWLAPISGPKRLDFLGFLMVWLEDKSHGFLDYCKTNRGLSVHTLRSYAQDLNAFRDHCASGVDPLDDPVKAILSFLTHLREIKKVSPSTVRRRVLTVRAMLQWALADRPDARASIIALTLDLKVPMRLPRPLDRETIRTVLQSCNGVRSGELDQQTALIIKLLVVTGLRISELLSIRVKDLSGACSRLRVMGKGSRERTVYVTNQTLREELERLWIAQSTSGDPDCFIFLNAQGNWLRPEAFRKRLKKRAQQRTISDSVTPHRFRHSAATMLIEEGVDIRLVQRLLGHASISTTELYTKVSDRSLYTAIQQADVIAAL